jgi:Response regulators consisting of a CheY-like receiver domain and a winged-helix DNA-binding domain
MRILHLDDDRLQLEIARKWLEDQGHEIVSVERGADALAAIAAERFDVALLDWSVPDVSGEEVLRHIRAHDSRLPVMFATANEQEHEVAHILELGADDYLIKPLRRLEFLARMNALARRAGVGGAPPADGIAPYSVHREPRAVSLAGQAVPMSARMTDLAIYLFDKRGEIVTRKEIFRRVWGLSKPIESRTIDTFVSRLRGALELDGRHGWRIISIYDHGYRLEKID